MKRLNGGSLFINYRLNCILRYQDPNWDFPLFDMHCLNLKRTHDYCPKGLSSFSFRAGKFCQYTSFILTAVEKALLGYLSLEVTLEIIENGISFASSVLNLHLNVKYNFSLFRHVFYFLTGLFTISKGLPCFAFPTV
jgi:hypothetical protein